jgi:hypothetical protein
LVMELGIELVLDFETGIIFLIKILASGEKI